MSRFRVERRLSRRDSIVPHKDGYRILSLDGGGSWALLQVMALKSIYGDVPGHKVLAHFDLVAANSGGSIVLAALAEGMLLSKIEELFLSETKRRKIFVALPWWKKYLRPTALLRLAGIGPRYSTRAKLAGLQELLPDKGGLRLDQLSQAIQNETGHLTHFLIVSCDYQTGRAVFFRSNTASRASNFDALPMPVLTEAVHASTNAPINYFDHPADLLRSRYWDGGVSGHNNPVLAAVLEPLAYRVPRSGITVLSLGTGTVRLPVADGTVQPPLAQKRDRSTLTGDIQKMALSILDDPPDAATFISHVTLNQALPDAPDQQIGTGCIVRLSPVIRPVKEGGAWRLPKGLPLAEFVALTDLDMDAVENAQVDLIKKLGTAWIADAVPNQAIRSGVDFCCEIGHSTFSAGKQAWQILQHATQARTDA
jgi:uncharacterized protein